MSSSTHTFGNKAAPRKRSAAKPRRQNQQALAERSISYGGLIEEYHDPTAARTAIKIGAIAVVGFLVWAMIAPVHELAIGQGTILPTGFVQRMQHLEGGNVSKIFVQEGQTVAAGTPLIQLDDLSLRAELGKAEARLEFVELALQRQKQISSGTSESLTPRDVDRFNQLLRSQQSASLVDQNFRDAQLDVVLASIDMKLAEAEALKKRVVSIDQEYELVSEQFVAYDRAVKSGAVSRRERDNVLRDKLQLESERATLQGQLQTSQAAVNEAKARAEELKARFRQQAVVEVTDLEVQRAETQELVSQVRDRLSRMIIRAPLEGTVNNLSVRNPGQVVSPGEIIVELVPTGGSVFAEIDIPTDKIGFVHDGMEANVKVLTFDFARFGAIEGKVSDVSPTSIMDAQGNFAYRVRIALDKTFVGVQSDGREVTPGMAVTAEIKIGDKSVLSYLLKPLRAISDRAFSER